MEYPQVEQPPRYQRKLLPHQLTSIHRMEAFEREKGTKDLDGVYEIDTDIGIQADITGYGKTCSMIGLIVRDNMEWDVGSEYLREEVHSSVRGLRVRRKTRHGRLLANLIVCSQSIVSQWRYELELTNLSFHICKSRRTVETAEPSQVDVVLCTPTMYNILIAKEKGRAWKRFVYDEPGPCHIPSMRPLVAGFTWFVTATPETLRWKYQGKSSHYCASLCLGLLENTFFRALQIKNQEEYVRRSWIMPPVEHAYHECWQPVCTTVRGLVPNAVEKMIEAGNIRGAIVMLGGAETDNIVDIVQERFKEDLLEAEHKIARYQRRQDISLVEEWKRRKERIESNIASLGERYARALKSPCNICLSDLKCPVLMPCCQNLFCGACIFPWLREKSSCPLCRRASMDPARLTYVVTDDEEKETEQRQERGLSKPEMILKLVKESPESKFIVFSEEDATFSALKTLLNVESIRCAEIRGRIETRERIITDFKNGAIKILFLNSRNNGAGIDLQECTDIVMYHKMGNDIQTQILGRANRIGRNESLKVHHLLIV